MTETPQPPVEDDDVKIVEQSVSAIKQKIGDDVDFKQVLEPEVVGGAQEVADSRQQDFLVWVRADLDAVEETYRKLEGEGEAYDVALASMKTFALSAKSRGGTFGYGLASQIAKSLYDFCEQHFRPESNHLLVVRKHLDGLGTIFRHEIVGDGGAVGAELFSSMQQLVQKYK